MNRHEIARDIEREGEVIMSEFGKLDGYSKEIQDPSIAELRCRARQWVEEVNRELPHQNARGIQMCLSWFDWIYRIATGTQISERFLARWNDTAFRKMQQGDPADAAYFRRWYERHPSAQTPAAQDWLKTASLAST